MHKPPSPRAFWQSVRQAAIDFNNDNAFKLAASLSFSMIFAIGPLLIVVISLAGIFWGQQAVEGKIYISRLRTWSAVQQPSQIQDIIKYIQQSKHPVAGAIVGGVVLVIGSNRCIHGDPGFDQLYLGVCRRSRRRVGLYLLISRLISFSLIVAFGFISMVSLVLNSLMDLLSDYLVRYFSHLTIYFFYAVNLLLILAVTVLLFMIIFRILPDAIIGWRDAFIGAIFTALLFIVGKLLISRLPRAFKYWIDVWGSGFDDGDPRVGILFVNYPLFRGGIYQDACHAKRRRDPAERQCGFYFKARVEGTQ